MITHASFRNFKSLRDVDIDLERLTVIVGPNASGKTSILQGLYLLSSYVRSETVHLPATLDLLLSSSAAEYKIVLTAADLNDSLKLILKTTGGSERAAADMFQAGIGETNVNRTWLATITYEHATSTPNGEPSVRSETSAGKIESSRVSSLFRNIRLCSLDSRTLAQTTHEMYSSGFLRDGRGLASRLALMALKDPEKFGALQEQLRTLIPSVTRLRFDRVAVTNKEIEHLTVDELKIPRQVDRVYQEDLILFDTSAGKGIPANLASEGTLLALGLLAELFDFSQTEVLLIDDIEHSLHPKAQRQLVALIRKILDENPELQIIATTHSPFIVNELDPSEVRVTFATDDGSTCCRRLDQHPEFDRWKDELWPGEFWSVVGEAWIANGKAVEQHG